LPHIQEGFGTLKMLVLALQFSRCYLTPDPFSIFVTGKGDKRGGLDSAA